MKKYFRLLRVHHYIKNLLVFFPLACSGQFFDKGKILNCICGFICFCAISSAIYIINDIRDVEADRNHSSKCNRPIAAGEISINKALIISCFLLCVVLLFNCYIFSLYGSILLFIYFALNIAYSFGLKSIPIVDVAIIASGFVIRVIYGGIIADIKVSEWLYLAITTFSLFFALGKRRNEFKNGDSDHSSRSVLKYYTRDFLDKHMYLCLCLSNAFYALWSMDDETVARYNGKNIVFTVPLVLLITMKYCLAIEGDSDGDPVEVLIHDKVLILMCLLYSAVMFSVLYL